MQSRRQRSLRRRARGSGDLAQGADHAEQVSRTACSRGIRIPRDDRVDDRRVLEHRHLGALRARRELELVAHALRVQPPEHRRRRWRGGSAPAPAGRAAGAGASTPRGRLRRRHRPCPAGGARNSSISSSVTDAAVLAAQRPSTPMRTSRISIASSTEIARTREPLLGSRSTSPSLASSSSAVRTVARLAANVSLRSASIRRWLGAYSPRTIALRMMSVTRSSAAASRALDDRRHRVSFGSPRAPAASSNHYCQQYRGECLVIGRSACASPSSAWVKRAASTPPICSSRGASVVGTDLHVRAVPAGVELAADIAAHRPWRRPRAEPGGRDVRRGGARRGAAGDGRPRASSST